MSENNNEDLAKKVADELMDRIYREVGKSVLKKIFWFFASAVIVIAVLFDKIPWPNWGAH